MKNNILRNFINIIKYNFSTLISYELFHKGFALIFMVPVAKYIFYISMKVANIKYLSTDDIVNLITNPISVILILLIIVGLGFYLFWEFISLILCFDKSSKSEKIGLFELIKISLKKSSVIFYPRNILLIVFVLLIIPLTNLTLTISFIGKLKLPEYILDYINSNYIFNIIYIILMLILYVLAIRWVFSINEIALSTDTFKEARVKSANLVKGRALKIIFYSIALFVIATVIGYIIYNFILILMIPWTKYYVQRYSITSMSAKGMFINRWFILQDYIKLTALIFTPIINIGFISSIYYEYKGIDIYISKKKEHKKSIIKSIVKVVIILFVFQVESIELSSYVFNTSFFYNTTAIAHRAGALIAPENTLAAINEAASSRSEYAEIDVQETKDGELIIMHDSNFKRTTGINKNVWDVDYDEVKTYDAGSHFDQDFAGEKIPTLEEMIKYSKGKVKLMIEIKINGHEKGNIEKQVIDIIEANKFENQCIIASMDKNVLKKVKEINPNLKTCYLTAVAYGDFYKWDYVDIYGIESTFVNKEVVEEIHNAGKKIFVWTINNQKLMNKMIDIDVDSIITDNPYLVLDSIYWKQNGYINNLANHFFK